ncbi:MAG: sodium-dependent transporter [candidate division Zixibacteria bacterium]
MREQWDNRFAFILAAIGSAIGLGNIWRFPFVCYQNGGGAFLIAYIIALLTTGIPLLVLEFGLGHKMEGSSPLSFGKIRKKLEWFGWIPVLIGFMIVTYYSVIMAYCIKYGIASITQAYAADPSGYFFNNTLGITSGPFEFGGFTKQFMWLAGGLIVSWIWIIFSVWKGAKTVSKVVYFTVLVPWLLLIVFVIRGITLPGAMDGLAYYLTPDFSKLLNLKVWMAAYTQIFFSLSVGFGIMIAYSSFLPRKTDLVNNAFIVGFADALTAFVGGLAVFGALGYHAHILGKPIDQLSDIAGPGLAFVTYPAIISNLPLAPMFGVLFFLMLLTLAIDSAFSMVEGLTASIIDKWGFSHLKANLTVSSIALLIGLVFCTGAGLYWLDTLDHFMNYLALGISVLGACIFIGWTYGAGAIKEYANSLSDFGVGKWWEISIKYFTPILLVILIGNELIERIKGSYEGYGRLPEFLAGWLILALLAVASYLMYKSKGKE